MLDSIIVSDRLIRNPARANHLYGGPILIVMATFGVISIITMEECFYG